jgi:hypothetical protein
MSAASNYTENNVLNALLRGIPFPLPVNTYVGLHTDDPGEAGGNEVTTTDYPAYVRRTGQRNGVQASRKGSLTCHHHTGA